jgi:hypothetical protein
MFLFIFNNFFLSHTTFVMWRKAKKDASVVILVYVISFISKKWMIPRKLFKQKVNEKKYQSYDYECRDGN